MNTCKCGNAMPEAIDEFGDIRNPVCVCCWLNPDIENSVIDKINHLENSLKEVEDDYSSIERQIDELQGDLDEMADQKRAIKKKIAELRKNGDTTTKTLKQKLIEWAKGEPRHVPTIETVFGAHS